MVLNAVQDLNPAVAPPPDETPFWENRDQMSLPVAVRLRLTDEGLSTIYDFSDFKTDQISQAFKNMRMSIPPVPGVAAVVDGQGVEVFPAVPPIRGVLGISISAKCALRLKIASIAYHYYVSIGRNQTTNNMHYTNVLKSFYVEWEAVVKLSKEDKPNVPKLTKHLTPIRWVESFKDCVLRTFGVRDAPLSYVIREESEVKIEVEDPLSLNKAYGASGSIIEEMTKRMSYDDPLFKTDNGSVYSMLEEATRSTIYANTIKPFSRSKDGRKAWLVMVSPHNGDDKWEQLQKDKMKFLMNTTWNGKTYSLEKFTGAHRKAYVQLQEAK